MGPASANRPPRRAPLFRPAILFGAFSVALFWVALPGLASGAKLSDQNRDGVVDLADLALFSQSELGQDWQTVDWCQWLQSPLKKEKHLQELLDFINEYFRCDQGDPLAIRNANRHPTRLAWSRDAQQIFVTDPKVGSVFIYDSVATLTGELKALGKPLGVAVSIRRATSTSGTTNLTSWRCTAPTAFQTATIGAGTLRMPNDLAFDQNGQLYVVDSKRNRSRSSIRRLARACARSAAASCASPRRWRFPVRRSSSPIRSNSLVKVFDLQGNLLRSFGGEATQGFMNYSWQGKFARIQSLAVDSTGRLHVLDSHMGIIQILSAADGSYIGFYGAKGSAPGELDLPLDIDINQYGETAVANTRNERVELLTAP